jgi:hypothetical protein
MRSAAFDWSCAEARRYVYYLARTFAKLELEQNVMSSDRPDAAKRIFGVEWHDLFETAANETEGGTLLIEVRLLFFAVDDDGPRSHSAVGRNQNGTVAEAARRTKYVW